MIKRFLASDSMWDADKFEAKNTLRCAINNNYDKDMNDAAVKK